MILNFRNRRGDDHTFTETALLEAPLQAQHPLHLLFSRLRLKSSFPRVGDSGVGKLV